MSREEDQLRTIDLLMVLLIGREGVPGGVITKCSVSVATAGLILCMNFEVSYFEIALLCLFFDDVIGLFCPAFFVFVFLGVYCFHAAPP